MADDRTFAHGVVEVRVYADGEPHRDGRLPYTSADQSYAFCGAKPPGWVHPLDARYVGFHVPGRSKRTTLPTFWTTCEPCEASVRGEDDDTLRQRLFATDESYRQVPGTASSMLAAFRRADLGAQPLGQ